jgi:hypothetical protein
MSRSERISQQLGMSHGTAAHRLRKNILFSFAQRLNEDTCFKCHQRIESAEDLSIEHKLPWEGRSTELFWDLDNIAFSHLKCNRPHKFNEGNLSLYKFSPTVAIFNNAPDGMAWCVGHKDYRKIEEFHSNQRNVRGVASYCKECRKVRLD